MSASDKVKNKAQEVAGKVKQHAGKVSGDESMETDGLADEVKADMKQAREKVKDALKD